MSNENTGGPAFPLPSAAYKEPIPGGTELFGMTLRDYFAMKAMQGALAGTMVDGTRMVAGDEKKIANIAYLLADAMLEARK